MSVQGAGPKNHAGLLAVESLVRGPGAGPIDVLLSHSLFMALDPKQIEKNRPYPPLGTLYAAAMLRDAGWRVAVFDAMLASGPEAFERALDATRPRAVVIYEDSFNFLSKMCLATMRHAALEMVGYARLRHLPVLVAGSDATDAPQVFLEGAGAATAVLLGEAEHRVVDAIEVLLGMHGEDRSEVTERPESSSLASLERLRAVQGIALATGGEAGGSPWRSAARPPERDPDRFPLPARDLVDLAAYRRVQYGEPAGE